MKKLTLLMAAVGVSSALTAESINIPRQDNVSLDIYQQSFAMVEDIRSIKLNKGEHDLTFDDVSNKLIADSILFNLSDAIVAEQSFDYKLITEYNIRKLSLNKEVILITSFGNEDEQRQKATILTVEPELLLETSYGIISLNEKDNYKLIYPDVTDSIAYLPKVKLKAIVDKKSEQDISLTYLTSNISWSANHIAQLSENRTKLELSAFANIINNTNLDYNNVNVNLIAGDVQQSLYPIMAESYADADMRFQSSDSIASKSYSASNEAIGNMQLFNLASRVSLPVNQMKSFQLLPKATIDVVETLETTHMFYGKREYFNKRHIERPNSVITFNNSTGYPLPAGKIRVYENSNDAKKHFVGENFLNDSAKNEKVKLDLGKSYDVQIIRKQTNYQPYPSLLITDEPNGLERILDNGGEAEYEISITNESDKEADIHLEEVINGDIIDVLDSSLPYDKVAANVFSWNVIVPAKETKTITYKLKSQTHNINE